MLMRRGMELLRAKIVRVLRALAGVRARVARRADARVHASAAGAADDRRQARDALDAGSVLDLADLDHRIATLPARGVKGTTGTQASFLEIFGGDHEKVRELDAA